MLVSEVLESEKDKSLLWKENSRSVLLQTPVLTVLQTESISPDGKTGKYIVMDAYDWVVVVPVIENKFVIVRQYRHGSKKISMEFPGGALEKGEDASEGAKRELLEETGYMCENLTLLGSFSPNPALMSNRVHIFLAENLKKIADQELDNDEYVQFLELEQDEVFFKLQNDTSTHIFMATALLLYKEHKNKASGIENSIEVKSDD